MEPVLSSNGLGRDRRIQKSRDFRFIRVQGRRLAKGCLIVNWAGSTDGQPSKLGVVTNRKIGGAVQRNRARRLLREVFRLNQHRLSQSVRLVLVARPSISGLSQEEVQRDFLAGLKQAQLLKADC